MHIESLIRETLPLQGFRIDSVEKYSFGVSARIAPDLRFHRRCAIRWAFSCILDTP